VTRERAAAGADTAPRRRRVGVIGTFVWDVIHGRDTRTVPVQEWGGITYSLSGLDAALPDDWEIVPIMKVGNDLAVRAREYLRTLRRIAPDAALVEVPLPGHRVELRYYDDERRTEFLSGGIPAWSWLALKPLLDDARLDALYINFLSGWELDLETSQVLRSYFKGPIYCDFHMKVTAVAASGLRVLQPLPNVGEWCECFDLLQVNEDEMSMMAPDPMSLAATAIARGVRCLNVTLGSRGSVYFAAPGFDGIAGVARDRKFGTDLGPIRTALVPPTAAGDSASDPTGCGDVWGATYFSRLLAGDSLLSAITAAHRAAGRNLHHHGASGLAHHLRGTLSLT
jgi:sugar/nucleoside kinase (ribokinase family)